MSDLEHATEFDPVAVQHFELTPEPVPAEVLGGDSLQVWALRLSGGTVREVLTTDPAYVAKATAITTGGAGRLYQATTNAVICEGIGHAIALETGVASLGNMEAVQFHPTPIFPAGILLTEGCRGDGGLLKDVDLHRGRVAVLHGKGDKARTVALDPAACAVVERWMQGRARLGLTGRAPLSHARMR